VLTFQPSYPITGNALPKSDKISAFQEYVVMHIHTFHLQNIFHYLLTVALQ